MKIRLEFETHDLEEMLTEYFQTRGFSIANLDEIITAFKMVWPEGLTVRATTVEIPPPTPPVLLTTPAATPTAEEPGTHWDTVTESADAVDAPGTADAEIVPIHTKAKDVAISHTDLFDPTRGRQAPSRDELLAEKLAAEREIQDLLANSSQIKNERGKK